MPSAALARGADINGIVVQTMSDYSLTPGLQVKLIGDQRVVAYISILNQA